MTFDSKSGVDQEAITKTETRDVNESLQNKKDLPTDKVKLYLDQVTQNLRWESQSSDFSEPTFTEDENANEVEIDLSGVGNGKPILGLTNENSFQVLKTEESSEPFQFPENIKKIVDLNSGEWVIKPNNQGIVLKSQEISK